MSERVSWERNDKLSELKQVRREKLGDGKINERKNDWYWGKVSWKLRKYWVTPQN